MTQHGGSRPAKTLGDACGFPYARAVTAPAQSTSATPEGPPSADVRLARLHALVGSVPLLAWGLFHVWEQWAAFDGRLAWLARMRATSSGLGAVAEVAVGVLPLALWAGLHVRARVLGERIPGAAREGDDALGLALGTVATVATPAALLFLGWHVGWLWGARMLGAAPVELFDAMQRTLGLPWALVLHAFGLAAVAWHLAAALPDALEAGGVISSPEALRSARIVTLTVGLALFVLTVQLVGWLGTGAGTFWPITVTPLG
jgi:hypothetical protein